jgi:hypothetical protein
MPKPVKVDLDELTTGVFAVVIALSWNQAFGRLITAANPNGGAIAGAFATAVVVTLAVLLAAATLNAASTLGAPTAPIAAAAAPPPHPHVPFQRYADGFRARRHCG